LDPVQSRHGLTVLRLKPGQILELAGPWGLAQATVEKLPAERCPLVLWVRLISPFTSNALTAPGPQLGLALIKGPRFDWAVEKAAELGAASLTPLTTKRTVSTGQGHLKHSRWQRLAEEARKQCGRPTSMTVDQPQELSEFLMRSASGPKLVLDISGGPAPPAPGGEGTLVVGPEGGLTEDELNLATEAGFTLVSLGPIRLRSETASLAALAWWLGLGR
jgi:16S rRNA (uracil1498-N3)-methyltransferase